MESKPDRKTQLAASYKDDLTESDSTGTDVGQSEYEVKFSERNYAPPEILGATGKMGESSSEVPAVYSEWKVLFQEEESANALPEQQPGDHDIKLEPGKQPTFRPIYALSEKELGSLCKYLDENERKGFIRKSQSPSSRVYCSY